MVVNATNDDITEMKTGETTLSCRTNNNWKRCIWLHNQMECIFEYAFDKNAIGSKWSYDEVECDANFGDHEFLVPEIYDMGNNNTECKIRMKQLASEGIYQCSFQNCNKEANNTCKTKISNDCPSFSAIITLKVIY